MYIYKNTNSFKIHIIKIWKKNANFYFESSQDIKVMQN